MSFSGTGDLSKSLISGTAYDLSKKVGKEAIIKIRDMGLDEASPAVLDTRKRLLMTHELMTL